MLLIGWLYFGGLSMVALYIPGMFVSLAQGLSMPYAQAGAMAVDTELAGSASGAVVFSQLSGRPRCSNSPGCLRTAPGCRWRGALRRSDRSPTRRLDGGAGGGRAS